eukprot:707327-Rhodomonas_salina.1
MRVAGMGGGGRESRWEPALALHPEHDAWFSPPPSSTPLPSSHLLSHAHRRTHNQLLPPTPQARTTSEHALHTTANTQSNATHDVNRCAAERVRALLVGGRRDTQRKL